MREACGVEDVVVGVWVDDPPSTATKPAFFDDLVDCNIDLVDVMADTPREGWDPKWPEKRIGKFGDLAHERGMDVAVTVWPEPDKRTIRDTANGVKELLLASGATELCLDVEFQWKPNKVRGFRAREGRTALDLAGDYAIDALRDAAEECGCTLSLSTFTAHTENGRGADLAPHVDLIVVQAYSVRHRRRRGKRWLVESGHTYGPGHMQNHTIDRSEQVPGVLEGEVELGVGLAAYDQVWPDVDAATAMALAVDSATGRGATHLRYWSSKWIVGRRANAYARRFLQSLR